MNRYELLKFPSDLELAQAAAELWFRKIEQAQRESKLHRVALSGGRIAKHLFSGAAERIKAAGSAIGHVHFFWADERCVPPDDPESNFVTANQILFQPLAIRPENIHRLQGELSPALAVARANAELERYAPTTSGHPQLDLIILGMGEDGHVASLFPNAAAEVINCTASFLAIDNSPKPPPKRISISYAALAAAREVWVLASGKGKEAALSQSLSPGTTPLGRVLNSRSQTKIFSDINIGADLR